MVYNDTMTEKIQIDKTLTPENADSRGLLWVKDVIVDEEAPDEAMTDIVKLTKEGYLVGMSAGNNTENNLFGLYKPII